MEERQEKQLYKTAGNKKKNNHSEKCKTEQVMKTKGIIQKYNKDRKIGGKNVNNNNNNIFKY